MSLREEKAFPNNAVGQKIFVSARLADQYFKTKANCILNKQ
jgi:hypothetical protein